ncbi:MAG: hypothetical protein AB7G04_11790 [Hyphomonadaceae bacterium]
MEEFVPSISRVAAVILSALGIALAALPASANELETFTLKEYEEIVAKESPDLDMRSGIELIRLGMMAGLKAAQEDYGKAGEKPLFCLPADLLPHVGSGLVKHTIADELAARGEVWRRTPNVFIETVLVESLRRQYPCSQAPR